MIYAVNIEQKGENLESVIYKDKSGLSWHVQRTEVGLFVSCLSPKSLIPKNFECKVNKKLVFIRNTNCIFIEATDLETFCHIRNIIKDGYINQIWDVFTSFFTSRLKMNPIILQTEMNT